MMKIIMITRKTTFLFLTILFLLFCPSIFAQQGPNSIRLSGIVVEDAETNPIPNVTVKNISKGISILADSTGYFSLFAQGGDTILFEAMWYKPDFYVVPKGIEGSQFAVIEVLQKDAVVLDEVTIRAFPTQQQFERALLGIDPGNVADKTLALDSHLDEVTYDPTNMQQYIRTYNENYRNRHFTYLIPGNSDPNNFLNPERWVNFIKDWQEGRFSEDGVEKLRGFPVPEAIDPEE